MSARTLIGAHRAVEALLETLPESWQVMRFKAVFARLDRRNVNLEYEMLSLRSTGEVVARAEMGGRQEPDEASLPRYLVAEIGNLVVNPMWLIGGGIGVSRRAGAVSPDYRVFKARELLSPRFIHYLLRSQPYLDQYLLYTRAQTTFDRRVQQPDLDNLPLPVPPLDEQRAIANYLDRETARIDTLIEEQQRLIEMLRERRQAVIESAVGHGLDPTAPMKPSGLFWIREVPQHWMVANIRKFATMKTGHTPSRSKPEYWVNCTTPWFTLADVWQLRDGTRNYLGETTNLISDLGLANSAAELLPAGTVVLSRTASVGFSGIMPVDMATSQDFWNWIPGDRLHAEYLMWTFRAMRGELQSLMIGSTHKTIYQPTAAAFQIPVPPIEEQQRIAAHVDEQTQKIDTLIAETERFIELSRERRSALITTAVTGQIDVREVA
ncbi:restriction endonuclease subunit S [Streptosporangium canum]|uniref:restriction endonuclease subunit S n=1 Tax=Streptosporangium canum TaxID=324952 RepID=UPI003798BC81